MCGIAGIINISGEEKNYAPHLKRMTRQMRLRGPDDEGYLLASRSAINIFKGDDTPGCGDDARDINYYPLVHISDALEVPAYLGFGHRRLSIQDLTYHGHQPMCDEFGKYWIIFNGEVYNFKEIRQILQKEGYSFRSDTDTEVILYAYSHWKEECLEYFNGMFAFAIYDVKRQEVFFARDRIGIKPFYYTVADGNFIFASDIKTIIASGLYKPEINMEGLWHNLSFGVAPRPLTCFKNVYSLEQAHWMKISLENGKNVKKRYWQVPVGSSDNNLSEKEALELLEEKLTQSIRYRLISDVEVGTFMSGGVDSTLVTAIASRLHPGIKAFTLGFDKSVSEFDELEQAKENADINQVQHVIKTVRAEDIIAHIDDFVLTHEEPYGSMHPDYVISKVVAGNGIKVILSGLGPDELFGGYKRFTRIKQWEELKKVHWAFSLVPQGISPFLDKTKELSGAKSVAEFYSGIFSQFTEGQKQKLFSGKYDFNSLSVLERQYAPADCSFSDAIEEMCYYELFNYIGNHHLYRGDQNSMFFSIEARFPFLDHHLVELAFRIPSSLKIKEGAQKYIVRQLAKKYIAPSSLNMKKRGFGLPIGRWMNNELKSLTEESKQKLKKRALFNSEMIDKIFKQSNEISYSRAWHLIMTELWIEKFIDNPGSVYE